LGSVYELTENLVVPVAIHALWNVYVFGSQYLVATGAAAA
ncbi:CPBP family intramembrane metalloprotease, partial [Halobacteriales archaeon QH_7_68_42]